MPACPLPVWFLQREWVLLAGIYVLPLLTRPEAAPYCSTPLIACHISMSQRQHECCRGSLSRAWSLEGSLPVQFPLDDLQSIFPPSWIQ